MNKNRLSFLLAVLTALAIAAGGFFLGVQPQLASAAADEKQLAQTDETNATSRAELDRLRKRFATLDSMQATLDGLRDSVPATASTDDFIRSLDAVANSSGASVTSVAVGEAQAYSAPASSTATGAAEAAPSGDASPSASPSAEASAEPSPAAPAAPAAPRVTTNPLVTPANFSTIPVSISIEGSYEQALAFTGDVQDGKRLFLITTVTSSSSTSAEDGAPEGAGRQTWTLGGFLYVLTDPSSSTATDMTAAPATDG